jgi:hypothetical protein
VQEVGIEEVLLIVNVFICVFTLFVFSSSLGTPSSGYLFLKDPIYLAIFYLF